MKRMVDIRCLSCSHEQSDQLLDEHDVVCCIRCGALTEQVWWKRPRGPAQWDDHTAVAVDICNDPTCPEDVRVRYIGSHDARRKPGYERVFLRSLREVERFEREHNVRSEMAWYDRGSGRGFDDHVGREKLTH